MSEGHTAAIILAAGQGTRMKSNMAKVLHPALGRPMVIHVLDAVRKAGIERIVMVVGHQAAEVKLALQSYQVDFALQSEQLGTGHAVMQTEDLLTDFSGDILVLCGDTPLLTAGTLTSLLETHRETLASATVLTAIMTEPAGYGRVIRGLKNEVLRIVEHKDATEEELAVHEINSGLYVFKNRDLFQALAKVGADNSQREYYLTDTLEILCDMGLRVSAHVCEDSYEVMGVNDASQLQAAEELLGTRLRT